MTCHTSHGSLGPTSTTVCTVNFSVLSGRLCDLRSKQRTRNKSTRQWCAV